MKGLSVWWAGALLLSSARCVPAQSVAPIAERYDFGHRAARYDMPGRLDEISGLAFTDDGRLFAHGDEIGHVFEIDPRTGEVGKRMEVGYQTVRDDFEGIAIVGERFFIVSSHGLLYEFREVGDKDESPYRLTDLGIGGDCEVEGLDYDPGHRLLLVACKTVSAGQGAAVVHRIPIDPWQPRPAPIRITSAELARWELREVHPSGIAVDTVAGDLVLVAARERLVLEIDTTGAVLSVVHLDKGRHEQPEGIAFGPDGSLYIADEKGDKDEARLTVYAHRVNAPRP